jgi:hypothetical protein
MIPPGKCTGKNYENVVSRKEGKDLFVPRGRGGVS